MLGADWSRYEALVGEGLRSDIDLLNRLNSSILSNSGKQLRPMLSLLTGRICGGVNDDTLHCAASTEMLHNATLIHDDVADESSLRRGRPTLSALIGPSSAVLVGDFWLARAMDLVVRSERKEFAIPLFSRTLSDLAEGEMLQLEKAATGDTSEVDYLRIIRSVSTIMKNCGSCLTGSVFCPFSAMRSKVFPLRNMPIPLIGGQVISCVIPGNGAKMLPAIVTWLTGNSLQEKPV